MLESEYTDRAVSQGVLIKKKMLQTKCRPWVKEAPMLRAFTCESRSVYSLDCSVLTAVIFIEHACGHSSAHSGWHPSHSVFKNKQAKKTCLNTISYFVSFLMLYEDVVPLPVTFSGRGFQSALLCFHYQWWKICPDCCHFMPSVYHGNSIHQNHVTCTW